MELVKTFTDALNKHASTNNLLGTDKTTVHSYGDLYDEIFKPFQLKSQNVLELGILSGASILAMADYFVNAHIYGADIRLDRLCKDISNPRITVVQGDCTHPSILSHFTGKKFDIILDDASHHLRDQCLSLRLFGSYLQDDGIYIIEDIEKPEFRGPLEHSAEEGGLHLVSWYDRRHIKGRYDDIVAVFQKKTGGLQPREHRQAHAERMVARKKKKQSPRSK